MRVPTRSGSSLPVELPEQRILEHTQETTLRIHLKSAKRLTPARDPVHAVPTHRRLLHQVDC